MKQYYSFVVSQQNGRYHYNFPLVCTHCGRSTNQTTDVHLNGIFGPMRTSTTIKVPYCQKHLAIILKLTLIKNGVYLSAYVLTLLVLFALGLRQILLLVIAGTLIWGIILSPVLKYLVIKHLLKLFDRSQVFDPDLGTLSFTAELGIGDLILNFSNLAIAQRFALANTGNPHIRQSQEAVLTTILRQAGRS